MKKRIFTALLVIFLVILTGCDKASTSSNTSTVVNSVAADSNNDNGNSGSVSSGGSNTSAFKLVDTFGYILNNKVHSPRYLKGSFKLDSGIKHWGSGVLMKIIAESSIEHYGLGTTEYIMPIGMREWVYNSFLPTDMVDGAGKPCLGGFGKNIPNNRFEALDILMKRILNHYMLTDQEGWEACNGHYLWQHYAAAQNGCASIGAEVGESISSTQAHIAFSRGAAKQYGLPWFLQFSFWHNLRVTDFTGQSWGEYSAPNGGHSPSLYGRTFVAGYMGGASHLYTEAGGTINFYNELTSDGYYKLSPVGEMSQRLNSFFNENPNVGINYIPFGIILDKYHGMYPGWLDPREVFQVFPYTAGDDMSYDLIDLLFPGSWDAHSSEESAYMVNGPYGDNFDVLLQDAPQDVINSYPCLLFTGNILFHDNEITRYTNYVKQGGTLILNTAYLNCFPKYKSQYNNSGKQTITDGKGRVIIYGPDYSVNKLDGILKELVKEYIPFSLSKDVEYLVNVTKDSLIVTLINNKGYYFNNVNGYFTGLDSVPLTFKLNYTGGKSVLSVRDLWNKKDLKASAEHTLTINPGEMMVLEFKLNV